MSKFYESHRSGKDGIYVANRGYNRFPSHFHQNVEIFVLLSGKQEIVVDGISFTAESGSVVFIDNFSVHSYGDSQKGENVVLIIPYNMLSEFNRIRKGKKLARVHLINLDLAKAIMKIVNDFLIEDVGEFERFSAFNMITALIVKEFGLISEEKKIEDELINRILAYVNEHYREKLTLKSLSRSLGYAEGHISRVFHKYVKEGFPAYVNGLRLDYVQEQLKFGDKNVTELIFEAGFSSLQTYYRCKKELSQ